MASRDEIERFLNALLQPERFKDYGPNGLQIEGRAEVRRVVCGVTASLALIERARELRADALFVHHGLFWRGQDGRLVGWLRSCVQCLIKAGINFYADHLPVDAHAEPGSNAPFGARIGLRSDARFGEQDVGFIGGADGQRLHRLAAVVAELLGRVPTVVPGDGRPLQRLAWCTGAAQGFLEAAIAAGADAVLTGEISEPQAHLAGETGVAFPACGHHATERYGAPTVAAHLASQLELDHVFVDIDNRA